MKKYVKQVLVNLTLDEYKKLEYIQLHLQKFPIAKSVVFRKLLQNFNINSTK